jgi:hypothetical protein
MSDIKDPSGIIPMQPDYHDPFAAKPDSTQRMECLHCGKSYPENEVRYGIKPTVNAHEPYWWCPTPKCDGAGVGFDIHPYGTFRDTTH